MDMLGSELYGGFTYSPNNKLVWYTGDTTIVPNHTNVGFIKVLPVDSLSYSLPSFTTQLSSQELLQNIVNYLHSRYNLEGIRFQLFLFKGIHLNNTTKKNEYYYSIYLTSSVPLSLSAYDYINSAQVDVGCYLLLLSGYFAPLSYYGNPYGPYPLLMFPNYTNSNWTSSDAPPVYAPNDILDIIAIFTKILTDIGTGSDSFFQGGDMAFFDSIDADFGEIDVNIPDPHIIMDEILNQNKPVSYFLETYPQLMETFYENMFAMITYHTRGEYPYLPVE